MPHSWPRRRGLSDVVAIGFLICDRGGKWMEGFRGIVEGSGERVVLTRFHAPNANAYAERLDGLLRYYYRAA